MAKTPNSRYFDTVGNGTGTKDAATLDGSSTPVTMLIKPAAGEIYKVERIIISTTISANNPNSGYAGSASELTNGFTMSVYTGAAGGSTVWDITDGIPIKANHDWKNLCHDEIQSNYGTTQSELSYRYTFSRDGNPVILDGDNGDELRIIINDDLTLAGLNLAHQYFRAGMKKIK